VSKKNPERTTLTIDNCFFMKNPANLQIAAHILILDADPRPSGFPYSTLGGPFCAEKAQDESEAGGTPALEG